MSRTKDRGERYCHKTLESYKQVLDSMVHFLGASGALLRQRIETGQIASNLDCEVGCLICSPEKGTLCEECSKKAQTFGRTKECAAAKICAQQAQVTTSKTSTSADKEDGSTEEDGKTEELQGVVGEPAVEPKPQENANGTAENVGTSDKDSDVCICAQVRKIKETASKVAVETSDSKKPNCDCIGKGQSQTNPLCACAPTGKEKSELESIIVERLNTVSKLVDLVRVDLDNLSGKSKSAALYKEIMKERSPLAVPLGDASPMRPADRCPTVCKPLPVRRRPLDGSGLASEIANDASRRADLPAESRPYGTAQLVPVEQWANFVQCIFQKKRQRSGHTYPNYTDSSVLPSPNETRFQEPPPASAYQMSRPAGPAICNPTCFGNLQRQPGTNVRDRQQYNQVAEQMQYCPQSSGVSGGISRDPRNLEHLQRARANFLAVSNITGVPKTSSGVRSTDGDRYGNLQTARNRYCASSDVSEEIYLQNYQTVSKPLVESTNTNYASIPFHSTYSDDYCDNAECHNR